MRAPLGLVAIAAWPLAMAADGSSQQGEPEVVISAGRATDAALAAKVERVIQEDPYIFAEHATVSAENGTVILEGTVYSVQDLHRMLLLARRLAGNHRVINKLELVLEDDSGAG